VVARPPASGEKNKKPRVFLGPFDSNLHGPSNFPGPDFQLQDSLAPGNKSFFFSTSIGGAIEIADGVKYPLGGQSFSRFITTCVVITTAPGPRSPCLM